MRYILGIIQNALCDLCETVDEPNNDSITFTWFDGTRYTINIKQLVADE